MSGAQAGLKARSAFIVGCRRRLSTEPMASGMDGALVFDANPSIPDLVAQCSELIEATARRASAACEVCGGEGELRTIHGLAEVLCPAHQAAAERAEPVVSGWSQFQSDGS